MLKLRFLSAAALIAASTSASADLFASGDSNILTFSAGTMPLANQAFFRNISGGSRILIQDSATLANGYAISLAGFYNGAGYTATVLASNQPITDAALSGVDLLITYFPDDQYTSTEIAAVRSFLAGGHNVLVAGDNALYMSTYNAYVNSLLAGVGSEMRLTSGPLVNGYQTAQLRGPSSYLTGTAGFQYAASSTVTGGLALFATAGDGLNFLAVQAIPEPETYQLMLAGIAVLGYSARRATQRNARVQFSE